MDIKEHIFAIVVDTINRKRGKIAPAIALYAKDILPQTAEYSPHERRGALQQLCREKRLRWGYTMYDKYFEPL